jgi:glyceraldehyde-3-phosphate dehydrogenase (NADP+)
LLGELLMEAGAPEGSVSILPMDVALSETMVRDDRFQVLSFTGSANIGWHLKAICGRKKPILELGGNAGVIVHKDAKLDWAAKRLALAGYAAAGQVCIKAQRLFVHEEIYEPFRKAFLEETATLKIGDPLDPQTVVGPMIDDRALARIDEWVNEAKAAGAAVLAGGERAGHAYLPTLVENAPHDSKVWREEIFGPVVTIERYSEFSKAISLVNDSQYGLQAGVFVRDLALARQAIRDLQTGGVIINDSPMIRVDNYPYGGIKNSGYGREGVRYAMMEMTELKTAVFNHAGE